MGYSLKIQEGDPRASASPRVSTKAAMSVCSEINGLEELKARKFLEGLINGKQRIGTKFYTHAAEAILKLLENLENNAKKLGKDPDKAVLWIAAHQGPKLMRSRRKRNFGLRMKSTHLQASLKPTQQKETKKEIKAAAETAKPVQGGAA